MTRSRTRATPSTAISKSAGVRPREQGTTASRASGLLFAAVVAVVAVVAVATLAETSASVRPDRSAVLPPEIALPDGFQPEGIEIGGRTRFFVGSLVDGAIYRGDLRSGRGSVIVPGGDGASAFGLEIDRRNRLFVAGGPGGGARVYDASTGAELSAYQFTDTGLIHDVAITRDAAYFTDSLQPQLYEVPISRNGRLGDESTVRTIELSGDLVYQPSGPACPEVPEMNLNGLAASPGGRSLISAQLNTGLVFSIDPQTGVTRTIDLAGEILECGNALLRRGLTLYVTQPVSNQVSVLRLDPSYSSAQLTGEITDPRLDFPTAAAVFGRFLYTANARFDTPLTPRTEYRVIRLPRA